MSLTKQRPLRRVRGGGAISLTRPKIEYILSMRKQKQHDAEIRHGASRGASHDHVHPPGDRFLATLARMLHEAGTPAHQLEGFGLDAMDALHVACAEEGRADVLLTTDDRLERICRKHQAELRVRVANPWKWLAEVLGP